MSEADHRAQTDEEIRNFIEAFARVSVAFIRGELASGTGKSGQGLPEGAGAINRSADPVPNAAAEGRQALQLTGLSSKLQKALFPLLASRKAPEGEPLDRELTRLREWLQWVRQDGFDPAAFITYQRTIAIHGKTQNTSGAIGAIGAAISFADALMQIDSKAIVDLVGEIPPRGVRSPWEVVEWKTKHDAVKAMLLGNGRALVFSGSKDVNIFQPLGETFSNAKDALKMFNAVKNDNEKRSQILHEFAVGEVKTATDTANLHERLGLASRETQTELRTDRFLLMAVLNKEVLDGGIQKRVMNNRDLTRFSHVFNLHHCWGYDGGRERHGAHWDSFVSSVRKWCGYGM